MISLPRALSVEHEELRIDVLPEVRADTVPNAEFAAVDPAPELVTASTARTATAWRWRRRSRCRTPRRSASPCAVRRTATSGQPSPGTGQGGAAAGPHPLLPKPAGRPRRPRRPAGSGSAPPRSLSALMRNRMPAAAEGAGQPTPAGARWRPSVRARWTSRCSATHETPPRSPPIQESNGTILPLTKL